MTEDFIEPQYMIHKKQYLPCPFCGSSDLSEGIIIGSGRWGITCNGCQMGFVMPSCNPDFAMSDWNKRVKE